jgi:hypothetical protein
MLSNTEPQTSIGSIQLSSIAIDYDAQIILNFYCNDRMSLSDATCCSRVPTASNLQLLLIGIYSLRFGLYNKSNHCLSIQHVTWCTIVGVALQSHITVVVGRKWASFRFAI